MLLFWRLAGGYINVTRLCIIKHTSRQVSVKYKDIFPEEDASIAFLFGSLEFSFFYYITIVRAVKGTSVTIRFGRTLTVNIIIEFNEIYDRE